MRNRRRRIAKSFTNNYENAIAVLSNEIGKISRNESAFVSSECRIRSFEGRKRLTGTRVRPADVKAVPFFLLSSSFFFFCYLLAASKAREEILGVPWCVDASRLLPCREDLVLIRCTPGELPARCKSAARMAYLLIGMHRAANKSSFRPLVKLHCGAPSENLLECVARRFLSEMLHDLVKFVFPRSYFPAKGNGELRSRASFSYNNLLLNNNLRACTLIT